MPDGSGRSVTVAIRLGRGLALVITVVVLMSIAVSCSCQNMTFGGDRSDHGLYIQNDTDSSLRIIQEGEVLERVPPGRNAVLPNVPSMDGDCLAAPVAAVDGSENQVALIPAGTCLRPSYDWSIVP